MLFANSAIFVSGRVNTGLTIHVYIQYYHITASPDYFGLTEEQHKQTFMHTNRLLCLSLADMGDLY